MGATTFEDFRDVLNTAAGNACRCSRYALAEEIAKLAPWATLWSGADLEQDWPHLVSAINPGESPLPGGRSLKAAV